MQKNVTIRDVAKEAGVSVATVSRALNQNYPVSDKLRQRINAAVAKLDFHPNAIARTLKTNNTGIIGFLVFDISQNFFTSILKGVESTIQTFNYNVMSCSTDGKKSTELAYLNILLEKKVDGIILNGTGMNDDYIAKISKSLPIVCSHRRNNSADFFGDFVGCDEISSIQELTNHLLSLGHRKIGLINGQLHVSTGYDRYQGFCAAMRSVGVEVDESYPYLVNMGFGIQYGYDAAELLMERPDRPTALVCGNDELCMGALSYLKTRGIAVPDDVSIVCHGDIRGHEILYIQPTTTSFNLAAIGNKTGDILLERIRSGNKIHSREIRYMTTLVPGNSTAPVK